MKRKPRQPKRKVSKADEAFYKLGVLDGEARLAQTISLLKKTNRVLFDELTRLDKADPLMATGVTISFSDVERILECLKSRKSCNYQLSRKLTKMQVAAKEKAGVL